MPLQRPREMRVVGSRSQRGGTEMWSDQGLIVKAEATELIDTLGAGYEVRADS